MKADMSKLVDNYRPPTSKSGMPYRKWVSTAGALALCLSMIGGGMVWHGIRNNANASADEMYNEAEANPGFTVQHVGDVTLPDIQAGDGPVAVLTRMGGGYSTTPDEEGQVKFKTERVTLYSDYETDWLSVNSLELASFLNGNGTESEGYVLKEVWFGKNPASNNQSDFLVLKVPEKDGGADLSKVTLTNNPENPKLSATEGGYYRPDEAGNYTIGISDGDVIRLVFGEKEGWYYRDVDVFDYDVTDGGYYLEDDYFHKTDKHETSGQDEETGELYVDAMAKGINSADNYKGSGAKIAFGADKIGTDLSDESITGELNTPNIWNYEQQEKTSGTGATLGLVTGVGSDGSLKWADGVSAPALFGNGTAEGRTDYTDTSYYFTFARKGISRTLSAVESEWGTAAEDLEKLGAPFWILDDAPSCGTDGHDIIWGNGSENLLYYRSGDRAPEVLPELADGENHNSFFGFSCVEDFVVEPGYTGPLSFFGYSDDDLWAFAAQVDSTGNVIPDTCVQVADIGGVHDSAAYSCNLWDVIDRVPYGEEAQNWRLFIFWLERDGINAKCYLNFSLPEAGKADKRETRPVVVEASDYESVKGEKRTFVLGDGTNDLYKMTYDDGTVTNMAAGQEFEIPSGSFVSIDGLTMGKTFQVRETGRENVWHATGDGFEEGSTAECTVGHAHRVQFMSTVNPGTLTIAADGAGSPEGGYLFNLKLEGVDETEIVAMDGYNNPLGSRFTDENGAMNITLAAGEILTLCNLPDGTDFILTPLNVPGWHVAEILLDHASAQGSVVTGQFPAYVIYRYVENEVVNPSVLLEQSVTGDWGQDEILLGSGALLSYKITVTNPNDVPMDITVEDQVPEGLTIMQGSIGDMGLVNGQMIHWNIRIDGGKSVELSFTCQASGEGPAEYENSVRLMNGTEVMAESNTVKSKLP